MDTTSSHDLDTVVLLRRPRPPKKTLNLSSDQNSSSFFRYINDKDDLSPSITLAKNEKEKGREYDNQRQKGDDFVIHPLYPRGPKFFPPGNVLHNVIPSQVPDQTMPDEIHLPCSTKEKDQFMLNTFLIPFKVRPSFKISQGSISRQNYLKLTSWFSHHFPRQEKLNLTLLEVDLQAPPSRVPKQQALLELQSMMKRLMEKSHGSDSGKLIASSSAPSPPLRCPNLSSQDTIFRSSISQYFCGQGRSQSPFGSATASFEDFITLHKENTTVDILLSDAGLQPFINPSEVAILESMLSGGQHLSFKAHFITKLPLLFPLVDTLTYLNLSFNSLKYLPPELFELHSLIFLSMRNNPIRSIPNGIRELRNLCMLCLSFCILSDLPAGLYDLCDLVDLDVSYNNLSSLSRDMHKLRNLRKLNVEGNQLRGLPSTMLSLFLSHIILGNNLMQPIFWKHMTNQPQTLSNLCCAVVAKNLQQRPVTPLAGILERSSYISCDSCGLAVFGPGLTVIRGVEHSHFRVKNLPFIFTVCSPKCCTNLRSRPSKYWLDKFVA